MEISGVIFDLDGVLCSTDRFHFAAWKSVAEEWQIPFTEADNRRLRGVSRMESLEILLEKSDRAFSPAQKQALADTKNRRYQALLEGLSPADLSEDARQALHALRDMGLKLAVGSSSRNTRFILERLGLGAFFDAVADGTQITRSKPDPEVFLLAARRLALPPARCLVVEDAAAGIAAAAAGGFPAAGFGCAREDPRAVFHLTALSQLPGLLKAEIS